MIHPTIGWRRDKHGLHKHAHGLWILWSVSRVLSKTMHYVMVAIHYSMLHRFENFSAPGTIAHGSIRLPPRVFARLLDGNYLFKYAVYSPGHNQNWIYDFLSSDWLTQNQNIDQIANGLRPREMTAMSRRKPLERYSWYDRILPIYRSLDF